jgi:hypothetical protein
MLLDIEGARIELELEAAKSNLLLWQRCSKETTAIERSNLDEINWTCCEYHCRLKLVRGFT